MNLLSLLIAPNYEYNSRKMKDLEIFDKEGKALNIDDVISRFFKDPIDICAIPEVYKAMIDYRNEHSENQQRQLSVSCKVIKTILLNSVNAT